MVLAREYIGPRQLLEAGIAVSLAKREYELNPERRRAILSALEKHPFLQPHLDELEKRFAGLEEKVRERFGTQYDEFIGIERQTDSEPAAAVFALRTRLDAEEARKWLFLDQPRKAHRLGLRPLEGTELLQYRKKRKRAPPAFRKRELRGGVHLALRPWGAHFAFENEQDFRDIAPRKSAGMARPNPDGIHFSYGIGVRPEGISEQNPEYSFFSLAEHDRISRHELDHGFWYGVFHENPALLEASRNPEHEEMARSMPSFLTSAQRELLEKTVVADMAARGPWALRNELHSYLSFPSIAREVTTEQLRYKPEKPRARFKTTVYRSPALRMTLAKKRLERLLKRPEFQTLTGDEKNGLKTWLPSERSRVRQQLAKALTAIENSPIPTPVIASTAMMVPLHHLERAVRAMDRAYLKNPFAYRDRLKGTRMVRGGLMDRMVQMYYDHVTETKEKGGGKKK